MTRPLTITEMRAQLPQAVRQSFTPGNKPLTQEQLAKMSERTRLEAGLAKVEVTGRGW